MLIFRYVTEYRHGSVPADGYEKVRGKKSGDAVRGGTTGDFIPFKGTGMLAEGNIVQENTGQASDGVVGAGEMERRAV